MLCGIYNGVETQSGTSCSDKAPSRVYSLLRKINSGSALKVDFPVYPTVKNHSTSHTRTTQLATIHSSIRGLNSSVKPTDGRRIDETTDSLVARMMRGMSCSRGRDKSSTCAHIVPSLSFSCSCAASRHNLSTSPQHNKSLSQQ